MLVASCVVITTTSGRSGVAAVGFAETGKRIFQMLDAVQDLGCDEACKYIKSRVLRAYEGRLLRAYEGRHEQRDEAGVVQKHADGGCMRAGRPRSAAQDCVPPLQDSSIERPAKDGVRKQAPLVQLQPRLDDQLTNGVAGARDAGRHLRRRCEPTNATPVRHSREVDARRPHPASLRRTPT